jgi:uncharacterized protein YbaR (Trm112 family)
MDLLHLLCCPECKGSLSPHPAVLTPGGRIKSGALECGRCGVVGAIRNFKYDFLHFDRARAGQLVQSRSRPVVLPFEVRDITIRWDDARLTKRGTWQDWEDAYAMSEGRDSDSIRFEGTFTDAGVRILRHPWSGRVQFRVDGQVVD